MATVGVLLLIALSPPAAAVDRTKLGEFIPATPPQPAPEAGFTDLDGKRAGLADFHGKPAVVNLWATWCRPCIREMPSLDRLQAQLKGRLIVAAVSEDRTATEKVGPFAENMGLRNLRIYLDPKAALAHALGVEALPTSIIIDAQGRIVGRVEGPAEWDGAKMRAVLDPLLDDASATVKASAR